MSFVYNNRNNDDITFSTNSSLTYGPKILLHIVASFQNHDDKLTFEEFLEGSKKDPTIIQALTLYDGSHAQIPQN